MSKVTASLPEGGTISHLKRLVDALEYKYGRNTIVKSAEIHLEPIELVQEETPAQSAKRAAKQQEVGGVAPEGIRFKEPENPVHKPVKV